MNGMARETSTNDVPLSFRISNILIYFLFMISSTLSSTHQTQPAREHDRAGSARLVLEIARDIPPAADLAGARGAAEDLR